MIPLAVPDLTGNEKKYLDNCIDTTFVSSVGEYVTRFEKMVAEAVGSREVVAVSAGTTGLHAALHTAGVKHGELVIVPTFTFIASANAVRHCGADPWLMDVETSNWCLDPELVEDEIRKCCEQQEAGLYHRKSGRRVAALMPVYTLGNIPDMAAFRVVADKYDLPLIVDAACAIGATYNGQSFGALADLSVLSFNGNKTVTCGGGGAVVGNDEEQMKLVRHLTTTARVWPDYDFDMAGFNYRMTNLQAAVGCAQMERLSAFVAVKRKVRQYYESELSGLAGSGITLFPATEGSSCWFSGIVLPEGETLETVKFICTFLKEEGIEARAFWKPVHLQKPYEACYRSDVSVSEGLWQRIVTLPCSTGISEEELAKIVAAVRKAVREV